MRDVLKTEELDIPDNVEVFVKARVISVSGPRGKLTKNIRHVDMDIRLLEGKTKKITLAVWQGGRKHVACLRTIRTLINNMVIGVTQVREYQLKVQCTHLHEPYRVSDTKCGLYMLTSPSTVSSKMMEPW